MQLWRKKLHRIYIWWQQLSQLWQFWKKIYIWILLEHNCCNYGNSETKDTVDSWWHNCCNCGKKNQIWIPVTTVVAIMAILKNPGDINCRNYGNSEDKKIYGSLSITIVAIMAILKKVQLTPDDSNCCNCGKNKYESRWQQLSQLWQFWKLLK